MLTFKAGSLVRLALLTLAVGPLFLDVPMASALTLVSTCSDSCTANCELFGDLDCANQSGIVLSGGADFDMHGHSLTCTSNCPAAAVTMLNNGSIVKNLVGGQGHESAITGFFGTGIACAGKGSSEVTGIKVDLKASGYAAAVGLSNCAKTDNNVIINSGHSSQSVAIKTQGVANSDFVSNNMIDGWGFTFWLEGSAKQISIDHNQVVLREVNAIEYLVFMPSGSSPVVTFDSNSIFDHANVANYFFNGGTGTITTHAVYCDPTVQACQTCWQCAQPVAPFPLP